MIRTIRLGIGLGLMFTAAVASANSRYGPTEFDQCFERVGTTYGISPFLLKAIARQESSMNPRAIGRNPNPALADEYGIGIMQISSWWLPKLQQAGITERQLLDSPCSNIAIGAWILADNIRRHGMSWNAVGAYNAKTQWKRDAYAAKIQRHLLRELSAAGLSINSEQMQ